MKVLNIGSINIDRTYRVHSFVGPGETISSQSYEEHAGGKGLNQSIALSRAGADVWHVGAIGSEGSFLVELLREAGVTCDLIKESTRPTGHAVIQVDDGGQNSIIVCRGANEDVQTSEITAALDVCQKSDIVLLQNEVSNISFAITEAKRRGLTVALNPSPYSCEIEHLPLHAVDLFIVNEVEAAALAGIQGPDDPNLISSALMARFPEASFLMTLGCAGSMFLSEGYSVHQDAFQVDAVDTTGAGDTFCGYFLAECMRGAAPAAAIEFASAASALSVTASGAASSIPMRAQVVDFLMNRRAVSGADRAPSRAGDLAVV